jgi:bifunctional non-homologous end joining protein LigD
MKPMLATLVSKPFHADGWVYEEKYDGDRLLAHKEGTRVRLLSRNAKDHTARFPNIRSAIEQLGPASLLLDGEVVVFDHKNVSRFQLLQKGKSAPVFAVFDCLYIDGMDLRHKPLSERRQVLEKVVSSDRSLLLSRRLDKNGLKAYEVAKRLGYEGLVAKDLSSPYVEKRSRFWLKVKVHQEDEFIIGGFTAPQGTRQYFGALLVGAYKNRQLVYVGKVGTGFDRAILQSLYQKFKPLMRNSSPFCDTPSKKKITFLAPRLVAQISYQELTADSKLRQPVFLGLREDKNVEEVTLPTDAG